MKVTLLDTKTGKTEESIGISTYEWEEGNYSCDCNRERFFGIDSDCNYCIGGKRFIVTKAELETDDDYECTLQELNSAYPPELLIEHIKEVK